MKWIVNRIATGMHARRKVTMRQTIRSYAGSAEGDAAKVGGFSLRAGVGFGKVTGHTFHNNSVRLCRELRYNGGGNSCEDGIYDLTNSHILATSNVWRRPSNPAIKVPETVWPPGTSLTIELESIGVPISPPTAWFDGITLDIVGSDTIFKNGFD